MDSKALFLDIEKHLLDDEKPSIYLNKLNEEGILKNTCFDILSALNNIPQEPKHHPEGDAWTHTMLVLDKAAEYKKLADDKRIFMWAALLHDVGKAKTTMKRNGRWTSYDHDRVGGEIARRCLREVSSDEEFNDKVVGLVKHHMSYLYVTKKLPFGNINEMVEKSNVEDVALIALCDRLGRGPISTENFNKTVLELKRFLDIISSRTGNKYNLIEKIS